MRKKTILVNSLAFIAAYLVGLTFDYLTLEDGEVSFANPIVYAIGGAISLHIGLNMERFRRSKKAVSK